MLTHPYTLNYIITNYALLTLVSCHKKVLGAYEAHAAPGAHLIEVSVK